MTTLYANPLVVGLVQSREQDSLPVTTYVCIPEIHLIFVAHFKVLTAFFFSKNHAKTFSIFFFKLL